MCKNKETKESPFNSLPEIPDNWRQVKSSPVLHKKGETLSNFINRAVNGMSADRADIIERLGRSAGISASTVNQILSASIDCPPQSRLAGFARVLPVSLTALINAAEADGCDYGGEA